MRTPHRHPQLGAQLGRRGRPRIGEVGLRVRVGDPQPLRRDEGPQRVERRPFLGVGPVVDQPGDALGGPVLAADGTGRRRGRRCGHRQRPAPLVGMVEVEAQPVLARPPGALERRVGAESGVERADGGTEGGRVGAAPAVDGEDGPSGSSESSGAVWMMEVMSGTQPSHPG